jgi:hypothetical protein
MSQYRVTCEAAGDARMIWHSLNEAAGRSGCGHEVAVKREDVLEYQAERKSGSWWIFKTRTDFGVIVKLLRAHSKPLTPSGNAGAVYLREVLCRS